MQLPLVFLICGHGDLEECSREAPKVDTTPEIVDSQAFVFREVAPSEAKRMRESIDRAVDRVTSSRISFPGRIKAFPTLSDHQLFPFFLNNPCNNVGSGSQLRRGAMVYPLTFNVVVLNSPESGLLRPLHLTTLLRQSILPISSIALQPFQLTDFGTSASSHMSIMVKARSVTVYLSSLVLYSQEETSRSWTSWMWNEKEELL